MTSADILRKFRIACYKIRYVYGGREEVHTGFWWRNLREGDHLEDLGVDGRIILKSIFERLGGGHGLGGSGSG
jgi:hypothetical protein